MYLSNLHTARRLLLLLHLSPYLVPPPHLFQTARAYWDPSVPISDRGHRERDLHPQGADDDLSGYCTTETNEVRRHAVLGFTHVQGRVARADVCCERVSV